MSRPRILIVEDDAALADVMQYNLRQAGYETVLAADGQEGLRQARLIRPDLMLLDRMLPLMDGIEVCRRLRSENETRRLLIVMVTAKSEETDQVVGFSVGADDYVTKPFSVKVLMERIKALMRRRDMAVDDRDVVVSQGLLVDRGRHVATAGESPLDLTKSEFRLLDALLRQPGRAFSRAELIESVLGADTLVLERTIDVHIRAVRKKLGHPYADLIETIRGVGYRFRAPIDT